jgi:hypothetical protein
MPESLLVFWQGLNVDVLSSCFLYDFVVELNEKATMLEERGYSDNFLF